ncbi:hypothetical protein TWF730_011292 [Orbilia blumenaviensis]|uniref:Uncharacterized protein n=1 Tax=Orbilia blumenaviensis TaxID=1796055 RepID=A0AAV9UNC5_9PEZI
MKCYGLASLMFVFHETPLHIRCLLVSGLSQLPLPDEFSPCNVFFDGRIFDGVAIPFEVRFGNSHTSRTLPLQDGLSNVYKRPGSTHITDIGSKPELSVCVASVPIAEDSRKRTGKEVGCAVGVSFRTGSMFNRVKLLDSTSIDNKAHRIAEIESIARVEIARLHEYCGTIFRHVKLHGIMKHRKYIKNTRRRNQKAQGQRRLTGPFDTSSNDVDHCQGDYNLMFTGVDNFNEAVTNQWDALIARLDEMLKWGLIEPDKLTTYFRLPDGMNRRSFGINIEEHAAKESYKRFLLRESLPGDAHRENYDVIEARLICQHFLPRGFYLYNLCECEPGLGTLREESPLPTEPGFQTKGCHYWLPE